MTLLAILGVISSAIYSGTSLLYATLGEVVGERSGIVNFGLEGVLLVSAAAGVAATLLRCAAEGECDEAWHALLYALALWRQTDMEAAVRQILNHGATSGADMLAGFLCPLLAVSN